MPTQPQNAPSPQRIFETFNAFQRTEALKAAIELKLFTAVGAGHDTPAALAKACGAAERGVRILADYMVVQGLLEKTKSRYRLSADASMFLDERSPAYLGSAVEFLCSPEHQGRFAELASAVRDGGAPRNDQSVLAPEHDAWVKFARRMAGLMVAPADLLAQRILPPSAIPLKVLDIAAGHGLFGIAFARHNPQASIVAVDWANVLTVAKENAQRAGVADRYQTLPGSAFDVDFGTDYDIVLLTNFLHHFDVSTNESLMRKIHAALKPGGRAVALEFVPDESRVAPPTSASFALMMLATTPAGDAYTFDEYAAGFKAAGFARCECFDLEPTMQQVVVAER
ncbi:MAG TPA: class I SAM-dependent methyltransferase [Pirellulales bacterium]|nr:class I SAM-dependent methyltransferase [Pirellulales bacterium]